MEVITAQFDWTHEQSDDANEATLGRLRLFVDDRQAWGMSVGVDWIWRDLLVGLAENWERLLYEDWIGTPGDAAIETRIEAFEQGLSDRARTGEIDEDGLVEMQEARFAWEEAHDLARYLPGLTVPSLRIWSTPRGVMIQAPHGEAAFDRAAVDAALSRLGDEISGRLVAQGFPADEAVAEWNARRPKASDVLASSATGFSASILAHARGALPEAIAWGDDDGLMAETSWLALASACHDYGSGPLARMLAVVEAPPPPSSRWDGFLKALIEGVASNQEAGEAAVDDFVVGLARGLAGLARADLLQPTVMAYRLGIELVEVDLEDPALAGLAVHGTDHAPVIALNARACGPGNEADRRLAFASALSWLAGAALTERPVALAMGSRELAASAAKRARRLLLPIAALEDFVAADPSSGLVDRLASHFIVPPQAVAKLLLESVIWNALSASEKILVTDIASGVTGEGAASPPYVRVVR